MIVAIQYVTFLWLDMTRTPVHEEAYIGNANTTTTHSQSTFCGDVLHIELSFPQQRIRTAILHHISVHTPLPTVLHAIIYAYYGHVYRTRSPKFAVVHDEIGISQKKHGRSARRVSVFQLDDQHECVPPDKEMMKDSVTAECWMPVWPLGFNSVTVLRWRGQQFISAAQDSTSARDSWYGVHTMFDKRRTTLSSSVGTGVIPLLCTSAAVYTVWKDDVIKLGEGTLRRTDDDDYSPAVAENMTNMVRRFDGETWSFLPSMKHRRGVVDMKVVILNGVMHVFGGTRDNSPNERYIVPAPDGLQDNTMAGYAGYWEEFAPLPDARQWPVIVKISEHKCWIIGGVDGIGAVVPLTLEYDSVTNTYVELKWQYNIHSRMMRNGSLYYDRDTTSLYISYSRPFHDRDPGGRSVGYKHTFIVRHGDGTWHDMMKAPDTRSSAVFLMPL